MEYQIFPTERRTRNTVKIATKANAEMLSDSAGAKPAELAIGFGILQHGLP
ncbi:hypothetical protein [Nocardia niwae]|uniref:hypothetical protein n=1 Tax=Nocardia niwae TaxID=626084 RepID=UPI0012F4A224|nr:hypothetical protein [Nocardia niwae]